DRALQLVGERVGRLRRTVEVDAHAGRLAGAVVGDQDVIPLPRLQGRPGRHLEGVVGPLVDDVHADAVVLKPQVPAAEGVAVLHAGDGGAGGAAARELHPGADGERLVLLEVTDLRDLERRPGLDGDALPLEGRVTVL